MNLLSALFSDSFVPHGHCYLWKPELVWLNVIADTTIAMAYFFIPLQLISIVKQRGDLPFNWIFFLFGSFILACGTGHLIDVWTLWHPVYWFSSSIKVITAMISVGTAIGLVALVPKLLVLPRPSDLQRAKESAEQALATLQTSQYHLVQAEKMSSLGRLVAGVAHEINNPVSFIYGNINYVKNYAQELLEIVDLYQQFIPEPPRSIRDRIEEVDLAFLKHDLPKVLSSMQIGADRIRQIVLSLRNFSRLDQAEMKVVDIHEGIDSTLLILQNRFKALGDVPDIQLVKQYGNIPEIECYAGQLNQVFMNILSNALDALEEQSQTEGGISNNTPMIQIRTESLSPERVLIVFKDNGPGIPETVRAQIFDPFFTTKSIGKGTGLGLSISYQIVVDQHHGSIACVSEPDKGTEFQIQLPVHPPKPVSSGAKEPRNQGVPSASSAN